MTGRRFIVHVGAPKTGTSAFQEWAVRNRDSLLEAGYFFPTAGATAGGNHAALVSALGGAIADEARSTHLIRLFEQQINAHPDLDVIISSELMTTMRFLRHMPRLRATLSQLGDSATAVLVVRDQISWRNSCYAQAREMMTPLPPFRDYATIGNQGPRSGNWDFLERRYRQAGFNFATLPFDRNLREIGIVASLASLDCLAGLRPIADKDRQETNPSVGDLALLVADEVRAILADEHGELPPRVRPRLMPIVAKHTARLPSASFNGFDHSLAGAVRAAYHPSNNAFAQRNFGCSWDEIFPAAPVSQVSADTVAALPPRERRQVRDAAARVLMEAIEAGILMVSPR